MLYGIKYNYYNYIRMKRKKKGIKSKTNPVAIILSAQNYVPLNSSLNSQWKPSHFDFSPENRIIDRNKRPKAIVTAAIVARPQDTRMAPLWHPLERDLPL